MKTNSKKILSVFLSLLMTFMCMTSAVVNSAGARMIFYFQSLTVSAGQDVQLDLLVDNPVSIREMSNMILTAPDGFEITGMSETSPAFNGSVTYETDGKNLNFSIASNGSVSSSEVAVSINLHVSESCTTGNHVFTWNTKPMSCITADGYNYTPTINYGIVTVSDSVVAPETTTTTEPSTTTQTTTTETTTTTTTVSAYVEVTINSYPTKTAYTVGEELDLSGGMFQSQGMRSDGVRFGNSPSKMENSANVDTSEFDSTKAGTYKIYIRVSDYGMTAETFFEVTVSEPETTTQTTTTTTITTTTTTTTTAAPPDISIYSYPTKTSYTIGEELDLSGGMVEVQPSKSIANTIVYSMSEPNDILVDTSEFNNTKTGTYRIYVRFSNWHGTAETFFEVTVSEPQTTTTETSTTTETTTTTTATKHTYSVKFVDEETGQAVSGVRYNIVSYDYAHDLAHTVQTSGENPKSYEFISDTVYVSLSSTEQAIPDGYYIADGAERWELSADNPNLTVYLTDSSATFKLGDVDGDGMVNAVDATSILTEYALLSTGKTGTFNDTQNKSADVDGDGMINAVDATFVLSYYAYLSTGGNSDMTTWLTTQS